jgi:membrane protease YdiL (CAAX protease family)
MVIVSDGFQFLGLLGVAWFFSRAERRRLGAYGIGRSRVLDVLPGAFWGLIALSLLVFVLRALHLLVFDSRPLHGAAIILYGFKWLLAFLCVGFAEEYFFRGYIFFATERGVFGLAEKLSSERTRFVAFWIAATIMSLIFGAAHISNGGENLLGLLQVVLVGFVFSYVLWRTGSLWWAIGFHTTWDWAQSFLYGVADSGNVSVGRLFITHPTGKPLLSGGIDGPEGSILCVPIMLLVLVIVRFTTKPGTQPPLEQQPLPQTETLSPA